MKRFEPPSNVELLRRYSNTPHILNDLRCLIKALEERQAIDEDVPLRLDHSPKKSWALTDRLTQEQIDELIRQYHAGKIGKELAAAFNISISSVRRLLARHKARLKDRPETG